MEISYIIPYKHDLKNYKILDNQLKTLKKFSNIDIIVVEVGDKRKLDSYSIPGCRIIFANSNKFNKFWIWNIGIRFSKSNIVVLSDLNWFLNPLDLIECHNLIKSGLESVQIYDKSIEISNIESFNIDLFNDEKSEKVKLEEFEGIILFKKDKLNKLNLLFDEFDDLESSLILNRKKFSDIKILNKTGVKIKSESIKDISDIQKFNKIISLEDSSLIKVINKKSFNRGTLNRYL